MTDRKPGGPAPYPSRTPSLPAHLDKPAWDTATVVGLGTLALLAGGAVVAGWVFDAWTTRPRQAELAHPVPGLLFVTGLLVAVIRARRRGMLFWTGVAVGGPGPMLSVLWFMVVN